MCVDCIHDGLVCECTMQIMYIIYLALIDRAVFALYACVLTNICEIQFVLYHANMPKNYQIH